MTEATKHMPAFPQLDVISGGRDGRGDAIEVYTVATGGMSLRDYFAGQAMAGFMAGYFCNPESLGLGQSDIARIAYEQADAMMDARK